MNILCRQGRHEARQEGEHAKQAGGLSRPVSRHYQDVNTVKAGLVEKVEHYPGLSTDLGLMNGGVLSVRRPPFYSYSRPRADDLAEGAGLL